MNPDLEILDKWIEGWIRSHKKKVPSHYKPMREALVAHGRLKQVSAQIDRLQWILDWIPKDVRESAEFSHSRFEQSATVHDEQK